MFEFGICAPGHNWEVVRYASLHAAIAAWKVARARWGASETIRENATGRVVARLRRLPDCRGEVMEEVCDVED